MVMQGVQSVVVGRGGGWCAESDTTEARRTSFARSCATTAEQRRGGTFPNVQLTSSEDQLVSGQ